MTKPTAQACHAMTTYYIGRYEDEYGIKPSVNRNKARYTFEALLYDYDRDEVKALIDFYIKHYNPDLDWFNYNYEKVVDEKRAYDKTQEIVHQRRQETQRRLDAWRARKQEWSK